MKLKYWLATLAALAILPMARAITTDIATSPVVISTGVTESPVRPNLFFILDDSGSMDWDYLPDWSNDYYCRRASGTVAGAGTTTSDNYSVNSSCCRNSTGSNACQYGTSYGSTGASARRMDVPMATSDFNFVYYNPAITYTPPKNGDGTSKTSLTCANSGGTVSGSTCSNGWKTVKLDAYGIQEATSTTLNLVSNYPDQYWCTDTNYTNCRKNSNYFYPNQTFSKFYGTVGGPYYYLIQPGEYCDSDKLTNCVAATAPTGSYTYPAKIRWCSDTALSTCQGIKNATYKYPRYPGIMAGNSASGSVTTEITVTGSDTPANNKNAAVTAIAVATGPALLSTSTAASSDVDTVTDRILANLSLSTTGYVASPKTCSTTSSVRTCTITVLAPSAGTCPSGAITPSVTTTANGSAATTISVTVSPEFTGCRTPGHFLRVNIDPSNNSYPYPGTAAKASTRTDCAGTTCTYLEEMTNFANWFSYYRTRMQMMKTSASLAFSGVGDTFRVGYFSINGNATNSFLNVDTFNTTNKTAWYNKLFAANPGNSTPLRSALSTAGLIYGGVLDGSTLNGVTVKDPVQYSCQKNFTLLSTDGYWNTGNDGGCSGRGGAGCKLNKTSAIGNADGSATRPYNDGAVYQVTESTPTTTITTVTSNRQVVVTGVRTATTTTISTRTAPATYTQTRTTNGSRNTGGCSNNQRPQVITTYNWTTSATETTTTTSAQPQSMTTTTNYQDVTATTQVSTHVVVTTNGTVTSDTTTSTSNASTSTTTTSGPTATAWAANGAATTSVVGPNQSVPAAPGNTSSSWGSAVTTSATNCVSGSSGTTYSTSAVSLGSWSAASNTSSTVNGSTTNSTATTTETVSTAVNGPTVGTTTTTSTNSGGVSDTLADVAYYYYTTDLRADGSLNPDTGIDVGTGDLPKYATQRMNTYTLGLGIDGYMKYNAAYATASSGDYYDVANGVTASASRCTWLSTGSTCNWPTPASDSQANIDDLWHAAVNGRGQYFSASNPAELAASLSAALSSISGESSTAAAATTSSQLITSSQNFLFESDFKTGDWTSSLRRKQVDPTTGVVKTQQVNGVAVEIVDWDAAALLPSKLGALADTRTIYTSTSDTTTYPSKLKPFTYSNLSAGEQAYFNSTIFAGLPQSCATGTYVIAGSSAIRNCLSASQQSDAAGDKLVNFLRGQTGYEDEATHSATDKPNTDAGRTGYFRDRSGPLGDIVSSEAVYVKEPTANYADTGFADFATSQASNPGMVYVAANDGMVHAFYAGGSTVDSTAGTEAWAFVPSMVLPKLYNLASMNYANSHQFFVDATPVREYAYLNGAWKTLLVGGLGGGGSGYYALDITTPTSPKLLWEFKPKTTSCAATTAAAVGQTSDCDLGYSFGNPVITKLADGTWVVLVTSGYNNTSPGDGQGYLYILNAATGAIIRKIGTGVGSNSSITGVCATAPCPSGLGKIAAWVDLPQKDNTALQVYGGDLFGNLWRFDINDTIGTSGYEATQLALLKGPNGALQPITTKPELASFNGLTMVFVGTGRLLGDTDKADSTQSGLNKQSFYAIKDPLTATGWGDIRALGTMQQQSVTIDSATENRTINGTAPTLATQPGWFIDLPDNGERVATDPALALGTLVFNSNQPTGTACASKGESFQYNLDFRSGLSISGAAGWKLGNALATRPVLIQLESGALRSVTKMSDTSTPVADVKVGGGSTTLRRVSWRQLLER